MADKTYLDLRIRKTRMGFHGAFSVQPKQDDKIVVLGAGPIGLSAAAGLIGEGIKEVCVVDIDQWRLEKAKELGALAAVNTSTESLADGLQLLLYIKMKYI